MKTVSRKNESITGVKGFVYIYITVITKKIIYIYE